MVHVIRKMIHIRNALQSTIYSERMQLSVRLHKNSYSLYRSTDLVHKVVDRWGKPDGSRDSELPTARTRRTQVKEFDF